MISYVEYLYENMKCNVLLSFSLFILIDTPHYAVFGFRLCVGSFLYEIMYQFFFFPLFFIS